jgi:hypothetical protein
VSPQRSRKRLPLLDIAPRLYINGVSDFLYRPCKFEHDFAITASLDKCVPLLQVAERVPSLKIVVEREGLLHAFCCTLQGSSWIATQIPHLCK